MWRPTESRRQPLSRTMRSVCAPVMAASSSLAFCSAARASEGAYSASAAMLAQSRAKPASVRSIRFQCSGDRRSRTCAADALSARRLKPTLNDCPANGVPGAGASPAMSERANTRADCSAAGTSGSTSAFSCAVAESQAMSERELGSSPPRWLSTIWARRMLFSARSL